MSYAKGGAKGGGKIKPTIEDKACKVTLAGVLANLAVSQDYWLQIKRIVTTTPPGAGIIKNVRIGKAIKASGTPNTPNYQPASEPRTLTCWHVTLRGSGVFENEDAIATMNKNGGDVAMKTFGKHMTVFYRYAGVQPGPIVVIGYGEHDTTNQDYEVSWADGTKAPIELKQKAGANAQEFLAGY